MGMAYQDVYAACFALQANGIRGEKASADRKRHCRNAGIQGTCETETSVHSQARRIRSARRASRPRDTEVLAALAGESAARSAWLGPMAVGARSSVDGPR